MNEFTIYCTQEQTRKALELGAPIELESEYYNPTENDFKLENPIACSSFTNGYHYAKCPTAEQMIGWLATKGVFVGVAWDYFTKKWESYVCAERKKIDCDSDDIREDATHCALNEALNYLIQNNK